MKSVAERTVQAVRNMALLLRPSMLDDLGLSAALEWQGREVSRSSRIEVAVESGNVPEDLPDEYKVCVYRLVQEALQQRRAAFRRAQCARSRGASPPAASSCEVTDDGRGFDPRRTRGLGHPGDGGTRAAPGRDFRASSPSQGKGDDGARPSFRPLPLGDE